MKKLIALILILLVLIVNVLAWDGTEDKMYDETPQEYFTKDYWYQDKHPTKHPSWQWGDFGEEWGSTSWW